MTAVDKRVLEMRHLVDVPQQEAFNAWIAPDLLERWWGPHGYRTKVVQLDPVEGGAFVFQMTGPSGASCPMTGAYTKIDRPHLLAFDVRDHCVADMPEHVRIPSHPSHVVVRFEAEGEKTRLILVQTGLAADYQLLADVGWTQSLERVEEELRRSQHDVG